MTQATLSRELKSLGVAKGPDGRGGYRYVPGAPASGLSGQGPLPAVAGLVRGVERSNNLLVVKTPPGNRPECGPRDRSGQLVGGHGDHRGQRHHPHYLPESATGDAGGAAAEAHRASVAFPPPSLIHLTHAMWLWIIIPLICIIMQVRP